MDNETPSQVERRIMAEAGIAVLGGNAYGVASSSGHGQYVVTYMGRGDCDGDVLWSCDCSAGKRGITCKHVRAVGESVSRVCDETGCE